MAIIKNLYVCQHCAANYKKWQGRCDDCGEWNCLVEETPQVKMPGRSDIRGNKITFESLASEILEHERIYTGIAELDRVLGGGLVRGSAILIGGDPGIGKSTLLLQLVTSLQANNVNAAYISGEESIEQIQLRARRLTVTTSPVKLLTATNVNDIITTLSSEVGIELVVIDSIQTMFANDISSSPGTVSQVRACAHELINLAKKKNIVVLLVGHVTKDGQIAGPKVLEHMVDTVLYFEGERGNYFRILRAVKNRFGGVNEIGVFEMSDKGLIEISNPSSLFLGNRERLISGAAIFAGIEGTRPMLVEVQALIAPSYAANPRRSVVGWDVNRLAMVLAVIGVRYGIGLSDKEVYLNVAGGLRIEEPAADLAVVCALLSSITNKPLPEHTIIFGEVGLSGEIRNVSHPDIRLKEASKLGFKRAIIPANSKIMQDTNLEITEIHHIKELNEFFPPVRKTKPD